VVTFVSRAIAQRMSATHLRTRPARMSLAPAMALIALITQGVAEPVHAAGLVLDDVTILSLAVNGGADTVNPGTTCVRVSQPVSAACPSGYVAIQNNNKPLIAAAMQGKATSGRVLFYYDDSTGSHHCPGRVFTPCSVISIELK